MPLSTINATKELAVSAQPLHLAVFVFPDGHVLRVATHEVTYSSNTYQQRILKPELLPTQAVNGQGVELVPSLSITLADADRAMLLNEEMAHGFKGAELTLTLVMHNVGTAEFTSDAVVLFRGLCDGANIDGANLRVNATAGVRRSYLPAVRAQARCPWPFPTPSERSAAQSDQSHPSYPCGYNPAGGRGTGNFTSCTYTREACQERGIELLSGGKVTQSAFGGLVQFPPKNWRSRSYTDGKQVEGVNSGPDLIYGRFIPEVYGTAWVDGLVVGSRGDGNSTRADVIVCRGDIGNAGVLRVIVNDVEVPFSGPGVDPLFRWNYVTYGTRDGVPNQDLGFDGLGDSYGSMATIEVVVYRRVTDDLSRARVRILVRGPKVRVYSNPSTYTYEYSENPVWHRMDIMARTDFAYADFDVQTFIDAAAKCDASINYTDQFGATASHSRFGSSFVLKDRKQVYDILRALDASAGMYVIRAGTNGKVQLFVKGTLAEEQPSAMAGSNYATPISSKLRAGVVTNGYVAYLFDESNILSPVTLSQSGISDTPNRIAFPFINKDNFYSEDALNPVDGEDVARVGQEVNDSLDVIGINSFDQAKRRYATIQAERNRGNSRGDTGGTLHAEFTTSMKGVHLRLGQIIALTWAEYGFTLKLFRVSSIKHDRNSERVTIRASWHNDDWYLDTWGQSPDDRWHNPNKGTPDRPPFPWNPSGEAGDAADALWAGEASFTTLQRYQDGEDGTAIASVEVVGALPVNSPAPEIEPPFVPLQVSSASTGGTIAGGQTIYLGIAAKDSSGRYSTCSFPTSSCAIPAGTNTNKLTISGLQWTGSPGGYAIFAGTSPNDMTLQAEAAGTPASVDLLNYTNDGIGQPDVVFDRLRIDAHVVELSGVFGGYVTSKPSSTQLQFTGPSWTTNEWVGRVVSAFRVGPDGTETVIANYNITANNGNTLTVDRTLGEVAVGDRCYILCQRTASASNSITDSKLALSTDALKGMMIMLISGTGRDQIRRIASNTATRIDIDGVWDTNPGADTRFIVFRNEAIAMAQSAPARVESLSVDSTVAVTIDNKEQMLLIRGVALDASGREAPTAPFRMVYVNGDAGSVSGAVPPDPVQKTGDVFNGSVSVAQGTADDNGISRFTVYAQYTPPDPQGTFKGVHAYITDGGTGRLYDKGKIPYTATHPASQLIQFEIDPPTVTTNWTVFLASYSDAIDLPLNYDAGGTPRRTVSIGPLAPGSLGQEWCAKVTGVSASVVYRYADDGSREYGFTFSWTPPNDARFNACQVWARPGGGGADIELGTFPSTQTSATVGYWTIWHASETFTLYFLSVDIAGRANTVDLGGATPSVGGLVVQKETGSAGQEHAALVTAFSAGVRYSFDAGGNQKYYFHGVWTNPTSDPRFQGTRIIARPNAVSITVSVTFGLTTVTRVSGSYFSKEHEGKAIDIAGTQRTISTVSLDGNSATVTASWTGGSGSYVSSILIQEDITIMDLGRNENSFTSDEWPVNHQSETFTLYAVSFDNGYRLNSIVNGVTPSASINVVRVTGSSGREYAELVTNVTLDGGAVIVVTTEVGEQVWLASGTFTEPAGDPRYGGVKIVRKNPTDPDKSIELADIPRGAGKYRTDFQPLIGVNTNLLFLSYDVSGKVNTYQSGITPEVALTIPSQGTTVNITKFDLAAFDTAALANHVAMPAFLAALPSNASVPAGRVVYRTTDNTAWRNNSTQTAWVSVPVINNAFYNAITANQIAAQAIQTVHFAAQEVRVGTMTGPTRFRVDNSGGTMIGFIGHIPNGTIINGNAVVGSFEGAYFVNARFGPNINWPAVYIDGSGVFLTSNSGVSGQSVAITMINGTATINIDKNNGIKVADTAFSRFARIYQGFVRMESTLDGSRYAQLVPASFDAQYTAGGARFVTSSSATGTLLTITHSNGATYFQVDTAGFSTIIGTTPDFRGGTAASASAGAAVLPTQPVGFIQIKINGTAYRVPYYNT